MPTNELNNNMCSLSFRSPIVFLQSDLPPWITRLRMWDSYGTYVPMKSTSSTTGQPPPPPPVASSADGGKPTLLNQSNYGSYYYSASNPKLNRNLRVNIDNAWNPVDTYIYGPTQSSVFNQENKYSGYQGGGPGGGSTGSAGSGKTISGVKDSLNYISSGKSSKEVSAAAVVSSDRNSAVALMSTKGKRRLMLEIYDYETPKLCDHTAIGSGVSGSSAVMGGNKQRPCSPLESYVSTGRDLVSKSKHSIWIDVNKWNVVNVFFRFVRHQFICYQCKQTS